MRLSRFPLALFVVLCSCELTERILLAQGTRADYERAAALPALTRDKVFSTAVKPHWLNAQPRFWYRNDLAEGTRAFVLVDASSGERRSAFDHARLAAALSTAWQKPVTSDRLPVEQLEFDDDLKTIRFAANRQRWSCSLENYMVRELGVEEAKSESLGAIDEPHPSRRTGNETSLRFVNRTENAVQVYWIDSEGDRKLYTTLKPGDEHEQHTFAGHVWLATTGEGRSLGAYEATDAPARAVIGEQATPRRRNGPQRGPGGRGNAGERRRPDSNGDSPDRKWTVVVRDHNVFLRDHERDTEIPLSQNGQAKDGFTGFPIWSPDSRYVVVMCTVPGDDRQIHLIESSPRDQLQPKLHTLSYAKPGDAIDVSKPHLFDVSGKTEISIFDDLFATPWSIDAVRWQPDSREFRFVYNQRGHQVLRVIGIDAETGRARAIIDEQQPTFIDYAHKQFRHDLDETGEIIWMSERDGWNHLYLYDARTGQVKNQITRGNWVVRSVERVDVQQRQIWFRASGVDPSQDPYYLHECRINFDGSGFVRLTAGDGTHSIEYSPDREFLIDTYSRVDLPPVTELRRVKDGSLVCELEQGDWSALLATGWKAPERFVAKARDDQTDIFGVIFRPTNFDPDRKYPVIEQIYAGPQGSFVPKGFQPFYRLQALAELGFVVVQIDGMGTSNRSKAFHDVCCKNLVDAGFPDRIRWMQSAATKYPQLDLSRVGIYGGSAGGQNALGALLFHPDFYKVGVADCGCHDNRMDKVWWNELWMGWPIGAHYAEQSNATNAHRLEGKLLLTVGELDRNVDPASTMQVVNALIKADKDFDLLVVPGAGHGIGESPYANRRRQDFFVRHLLGVEPRR